MADNQHHSTVIQINVAHVRRRYHNHASSSNGPSAAKKTSTRRHNSGSGSKGKKKKKTSPIATTYGTTALDLPTQAPANLPVQPYAIADAAEGYFYELAEAYGPGDGYAMPPGVARKRKGGPPTQKKVTLYEKWNALIPLLHEPVMRASTTTAFSTPTPCACTPRVHRVVCVYWTRTPSLVTLE